MDSSVACHPDRLDLVFYVISLATVHSEAIVDFANNFGINHELLAFHAHVSQVGRQDTKTICYRSSHFCEEAGHVIDLVCPEP